MSFTFIGRLFPLMWQKSWAKLLLHAGSKITPDRSLGILATSMLVIGAIVGYDINYFFGFNTFLVAVGAAVLFLVLVLIVLSTAADRRASVIEAIWPDALLLVAANLKAGSTVDRALLLTERQKLGLLRDELVRIGKEVNFGMDLKDALSAFASRFRSEKISSSVTIITSGLKTGGQLAPLLEQLARNLRNQEIVEKKTRSAIVSYVTFIMIALAAVAPFLFALSLFLVSMLQNVAGGVTVDVTVDAPAILAAPVVSTGFLEAFSVLMIITAAVMGSLIVGTIMRGKALAGVRYMAPLVVSSLTVFFFVRAGVGFVLLRVLG